MRVIYLPPPQPPSPVAEGSEEGSSPRASATENGNLSSSEVASLEFWDVWDFKFPVFPFLVHILLKFMERHFVGAYRFQEHMSILMTNLQRYINFSYIMQFVCAFFMLFFSFTNFMIWLHELILIFVWTYSLVPFFFIITIIICNMFKLK